MEVTWWCWRSIMCEYEENKVGSSHLGIKLQINPFVHSSHRGIWLRKKKKKKTGASYTRTNLMMTQTSPHLFLVLITLSREGREREPGGPLLLKIVKSKASFKKVSATQVTWPTLLQYTSSELANCILYWYVLSNLAEDLPKHDRQKNANELDEGVLAPLSWKHSCPPIATTRLSERNITHEHVKRTVT